ncbi:Streptothricin hydrolase [Pseudovibrio axinellae]|uniref:Streptothricin hydrolase n=1 Tax=Pseudovibrio axinellae TaxID=989403 RepID=A0A161X7V4_9HYPH|nr:cysteine hydrolase family protein [Pseudovibrio axinellae]KZL05103.1 Streptothricin hydrolase [Pseudovibrio axinellae]SER48372.1 Nicotinamidase-related amidase [Pseudovibrio axinellae]
MPRRALIIVDCQNDYFPGGSCPLAGQVEAGVNISRLLDVARSNDQNVIHLQHMYKDKSEPYLVEGTPGVEINACAKPIGAEPVIVKNYMNGYKDTNLHQVLVEAEIEEIVMCGSMSQNCVNATARQTLDLGYPLTIIYDACATEDLEFNGVTVPADHVHTAMMASLRFAHSNVISTDEFVDEVNGC